ncbi:MAG: hypothetical protein IIZ53_01835 [Ruminococcus sp.]|nr:hypothetical protein [Ruminococcus sp.]
MKNMLLSYKESCLKAQQRITELSALRSSLRNKGKEARINELALDQRIDLLYAEKVQMQEVIDCLDSYIRRIESRVET